MNRKDFEIMAPAGNFECLQAAIQGGADSVYFGVGHLNMRSHSANNFAPEDLYEVVRICHGAGVRAYLTLNIVLYPEDLQPMREALDAALKAGVDAIIASDVAAIEYARSIGLEVHISTQLNVSNLEALRFYARWADVVVLARELNMDQVKEIYEGIAREGICGPSGKPVRIEMFAHGALCMATSGKCYLSLHAYGSSANRGACMQICRRGYEVRDLETGYTLDIDNKYIMSPKDLCTIEFMQRMADSGVRVFKIEGRARSAEYVKRCTECYRKAADAIAEGNYTPEMAAALKESLAEVFNRGFWAVERDLRLARHAAQGILRQGQQLVRPDRRGRNIRRSHATMRRRRDYDNRSHQRRYPADCERYAGQPQTLRESGERRALLGRHSAGARSRTRAPGRQGLPLGGELNLYATFEYETRRALHQKGSVVFERHLQGAAVHTHLAGTLRNPTGYRRSHGRASARAAGHGNAAPPLPNTQPEGSWSN